MDGLRQDHGGGFEDRGGNYATLEEVVKRWIEHEEISENYEILGVEMEFSLPMEDGEFPFVVDLLIRDAQGRIFVVDHKTAYYLYDDEKTDLMPQIPKYIGALPVLLSPPVPNGCSTVSGSVEGYGG